jgi:hypothetical protein
MTPEFGWRSYGKIWQESRRQSEEGDARAQARQTEERALRQDGQEQKTGDRNRAVRSTQRGRQSAGQKVFEKEIGKEVVGKEVLEQEISRQKILAEEIGFEEVRPSVTAAV